MDKKIENVISFLKEKYGEQLNAFYSNEKINEIVVNCVSLVKTFLDSAGGLKNQSLQICLFDKNGEADDVLNGVTEENIYSTISDIVITKFDNYSKLSIYSFMFEEGIKSTKLIGEIEIS
jgi:hypothetical protein